jgi:AcrR family transcriptional regulator
MKFEQYKAQFPYKGKEIYTRLFEQHADTIKTKKKKFAVNNLEKIFKATFKISSKKSYHGMSLRQLCFEAGLSMGGIYSCVESKESIAILIKDMVKFISSEIIDEALKQKDAEKALEDVIRYHVYACDILHHWFYFLYFETRSLPLGHQQDSKGIELLIIGTMESLMRKVYPGNKNKNYNFVATMAMAMFQEHYLKHWKYKSDANLLDTYADEILKLVRSALS